MKWIGKNVIDSLVKFRERVIFDDLPSTTDANALVVDSNGN